MPREEDDDCHEEFSIAWVLDACERHKAKIAAVNMEELLVDFVLEGRQGLNTYAACKQPADGCRGRCAEGGALEFVSFYFPQRTLTCAYKTHDPYVATLLCLVWCARMQYFYDFHCAFSAEEGFIFSQEVIDDFELPAHLQEQVDGIPRTAKKSIATLRKIMNLVPVVGNSGISDEES